MAKTKETRKRGSEETRAGEWVCGFSGKLGFDAAHRRDSGHDNALAGDARLDFGEGESAIEYFFPKGRRALRAPGRPGECNHEEREKHEELGIPARRDTRME